MRCLGDFGSYIQRLSGYCIVLVAAEGNTRYLCSIAIPKYGSMS